MHRLLAAGLAAAAMVAGTAHAQMESREGIALQNQILELRRDLQDMQQRGGGLAPPTRLAPQPYSAPQAGRPGGEITAQLLDRVARLEDELRRQRGQLDELANATARQTQDLEKQIADLAFRLQNGPQASPAPSLLNQPAPDAPAAPRRRPPELAMQEGNAALARRDYPAAEAAAREVLAAGRNAPRAADAQFLLGRALSGKRDFQGAAVAYDDAYNRAPKGSRAPDALLGLADSLIAIREQSAACATLDKLRTEFPTPSAAFRQAAADARTRANCR